MVRNSIQYLVVSVQKTDDRHCKKSKAIQLFYQIASWYKDAYYPSISNLLCHPRTRKDLFFKEKQRLFLIRGSYGYSDPRVKKFWDLLCKSRTSSPRMTRRGVK